jgi:hypothetical protein
LIHHQSLFGRRIALLATVVFVSKKTCCHDWKMTKWNPER